MDKNYQAFLVRFQRHLGQPQWQVTLEDAYSNQKQQFKNVQELLGYLSQTFKEEESESVSGIEAE